MVTRTCACGCGREFVARRTTKRYAGNSCKQRAHRRRKDPLIGSLERKRAQRAGYEIRASAIWRKAVHLDLRKHGLVSDDDPADDERPWNPDNQLSKGWDRGRSKRFHKIKRYRYAAPPTPVDREESYEPFTKWMGSTINGDPRFYIEPTEAMRALARERARPPETFPCRHCATPVSVDSVLSHTCEQERVKVVTITEYRALDAKIDQLTEAMARVEETVCMVAARFASDEAVQAAVNEFLETFADDETIAA